MLQVQPTHIGLDIAGQIMEELQPDTPILITKELLEVINSLLNKSIGLGDAGLYRISNKILTLIPFKKSIFDRIVKNNAHQNIDIYLIHLIGNGKHCYCKPFNNRKITQILTSGIIECSKIII